MAPQHQRILIRRKRPHHLSQHRAYHLSVSTIHLVHILLVHTIPLTPQQKQLRLVQRIVVIMKHHHLTPLWNPAQCRLHLIDISIAVSRKRIVGSHIHNHRMLVPRFLGLRHIITTRCHTQRHQHSTQQLPIFYHDNTKIKG